MADPDDDPDLLADSDAAGALSADEVDDDGDEDDEAGDWDASLQAPPTLRPHVARVLHGMADVREDEYYSLCCRLDTLEHVQAVLTAIVAHR